MDVILLSAGKGIRTNLGYPKQLYPINGKPSIVMSLEIFEDLTEVEKILIVYDGSSKEQYEKILNSYNITKAMLVVGGATRQQSVSNALKFVKSDKVMVHESARPFISKYLIYNILSYSNEKVVVPTLPIPFTVLEGDAYMNKILNRKYLKNIQLPQLFDTEILIDIHQKAVKEGYKATEDSMMAFKYGYPVRFIEGSETNIKITTPLDIIIANYIVGGME